MDQLEKILNQISDIKIRADFELFLNRATEVDLGQLIDQVDESDYALQDWAEAFLGFAKWLSEQPNSDVEQNFSHMLGYLHCCQMMGGNNVDRPNLQNLVNQCLTDYGYDSVKIDQN